MKMIRNLAIIFGWLIFVIVGGWMLMGLCATDGPAWAVLPLYFALLCSPTSLVFLDLDV